ncbi:MAG TPA: hypothetical protein VIA06_06825 [Candidatus Dormibacteraeota bacterium]|nr:hypothetical protein [Candidatus Dormibacteraeota bacterium]
MSGLPADFADRLLPLIAPGEDDEVADVLLRAAALDEAGLRDFLAAFAARVRDDPALIRAAELRAMIRG